MDQQDVENYDTIDKGEQENDTVSDAVNLIEPRVNTDSAEAFNWLEKAFIDILRFHLRIHKNKRFACIALARYVISIVHNFKINL